MKKGNRKGQDNFSEALKAALEAIRNEERESFERQIDAYLDETAPVESVEYFEALDDDQQEGLAKFRREFALDCPTYH